MITFSKNAAHESESGVCSSSPSVPPRQRALQQGLLLQRWLEKTWGKSQLPRPQLWWVSLVPQEGVRVMVMTALPAVSAARTVPRLPQPFVTSPVQVCGVQGVQTSATRPSVPFPGGPMQQVQA